MNLQHVKISSESLYTCFNGIKYMLPGHSHAIHPFHAIVASGSRVLRLPALVVHTKITLCQNNNSLARYLRLLQKVRNDLFGPTVGVDVRLINNHISNLRMLCN